MVNMVYRHGDRSPTKTFPLDPNIKYWPQGLGQLTQRGMLQEYQLGRFIKNRYITKNKLLNTSYYIKDEVYCRSTDVDRTIVSAQAQMNGLYPPHGKQVWRSNLDWQPIPIHVESLAEDKILANTNCPRLNQLYKESLNHARFTNMALKYKNFVRRLGVLTGYNSSLLFRNVYAIEDNLFCSQSHNLTLPAWANQTVMSILKNISDFEMYWLTHSQELAKLKSGPLLGDMLKHMKSHRNKDKNTKKAYFYSAHDTTVSGLLSVLKRFDGISPAYSSAVMLELYSTDDGNDHSVRIFYRFGSKEPIPLMLKGCEMDCPLDQFIKLTQNSIPEDRDTACGVKKDVCVRSIIYKSFLAAFAVTLVVLILLSICMCCCWCKRRRSGLHAARVNFDDGMLKDASLLQNQDYDSE